MKKFLLAGGLLLTTCLTAGCGETPQEATLPPVVKIVEAVDRGAVAFDTYPGVVKGRHEANLSFQTGGRIAFRNVEQGSIVNAGDVLMVIDPRDAIQSAGAGEAQVAAAKTQMELARVNLARYQELYKSDAIPAATLDQYQASFDAAEANYHTALANANQSRNSLEYTQLVAPAPGVITAVNAEAGQVVAVGQTVMTLVSLDEMEIEFSVPENKLMGALIGTPAEITFWANSQKNYGTVRELTPMADATTRTFRGRIALEEPVPGLGLGMTASVRLVAIPNASAGSYLLPLSAIYQTGDTAQVWVVAPDNTVSLKNVTVESFSGNEVIVRGLTAGDWVVTAGVQKLREGQTVRRAEDTP